MQIVTCDVGYDDDLGITLRLGTDACEHVIHLTASWFPAPCTYAGGAPGMRDAWQLLGKDAVLRWAGGFFREDEERDLVRLMSEEIALSAQAPPPAEGARWEGFAWNHHDPREKGVWHLRAVVNLPLAEEFDSQALWGTLQKLFGWLNGRNEASP